MKRYAIYYTPPAGAFADAGAAWLGWDVAQGRVVAQPDPNLAAITADPRKYGFHATIKAPFRLAAGADVDDLKTAFTALAARLAPVALTGLNMVLLDGFLALTPAAPTQALQSLAAQIVRDLDLFRAPLNAHERARRRPETLTLRQRELLETYGYPYVLEQFQFHMTLTGRTDDPSLKHMALSHFDGLIPAPLMINDLCLMGEDDLGRFHLLTRVSLG